MEFAQADDFGQAAVPMGMLLAWCVNMQLISSQVLQEHEPLVLRLRYQEARGSELLAACGGDLQRGLFNASGQQFLDGFYPQYLALFAEVFAAQPYAVRENWDNYQTLAQALTRLACPTVAGRRWLIFSRASVRSCVSFEKSNGSGMRMLSTFSRRAISASCRRM